MAVAAEATITKDDIRAQASDSKTTGHWDAIRIAMRANVTTDITAIGRMLFSGSCNKFYVVKNIS